MYNCPKNYLLSTKSVNSLRTPSNSNYFPSKDSRKPILIANPTSYECTSDLLATILYTRVLVHVYTSPSPLPPPSLPHLGPQGYCLFQTNSDFLSPPQDAPEVHSVSWPPGRSPGTCQECLVEMGFCDRKLNEQLLKKHNNNVALVVNELLSFTDNDWSTRRH